MEKKNILLIEPGYLREQAFRSLFSGGYEVTVLTTIWNLNARYATHQVYVPSFSNHDVIYAKVREFHEQICRIDGILTYNDAQLELLADMAERFQLPAIPPDRMRLLRSKYWCANQLSKKKVYVPKSILIRPSDKIEECMKDISYPCIVKPNRGSCSLGVQKISREEKVPHAIIKARQYFAHDVLVQSYLDGPEYSVEAYVQMGCVHVLGITEKICMHGFIEMGQIFPAHLMEEKKKAIETLVIQGLEILEVDNVMTHTEVILTKRGPAIVEINFRPAGDLISLQYEKSLGVSLDLLSAKISAREKIILPFPLLPLRKKITAVRFFSNQDKESLEKLYPLLQPGENLFLLKKEKGYLHSNADRMFCLMTASGTYRDINQRLLELENYFPS